MISLGIVIPQLGKYGGAERYLLECIARWQDKFDITLYATEINERLLREQRITRITRRILTPLFEGRHDLLLNATLLPKIWQREIGTHDVYNTHLWPTHLLDLHPAVWFPHEPLRILYDLRFQRTRDEDVGQAEQRIHFYPKPAYDTIAVDEREALLDVLTEHDRLGEPDRIVANSKMTARHLAEIYGRPVIDVVYPGVTVGSAIDIPSRGDIVLAIGQLWPHKRMGLVIEAIRQVDGVQGYLVGSGPERARLEAMAHRLGVSDRVFFLHGIDDEGVRILLARCFCVVFTPIREPFGIVALEALAAGKPLIAVDEGGFTEVVDATCAILVPPSPTRIADHIRALKDDPARVVALGNAGREVARRYSWDKTAEQLAGIITETYRAHRPPAIAPSRAESAGRPLVGVHYYNWYHEGYGSRHWSDDSIDGGVSDVPDLGYYSSADGETMSRHLRACENAGIDFILFNLHVNADGLDVFQFANAETMMQLAAQQASPLQFAVNLCLYTREEALINKAIAIIRKLFWNASAGFRIDAKPVIFLFWTGAFDRDLRVVELLSSGFAGGVRIATLLRSFDSRRESRFTRKLFHAAVPFSPLEIADEPEWEQAWQAVYGDATKLPAALRIASVSPGYDDRHLAGPERQRNERRFIDRADGETYRRMLAFVERQAPPPNLVLVTSFNEFHENSHIEPSRQTGDLYMRMTREFTCRLKSAAGVPASPAAPRAEGGPAR